MKDKVVAFIKKTKGNAEVGESWHEHLICDYTTTVQEIYNNLATGGSCDITISFDVKVMEV